MTEYKEEPFLPTDLIKNRTQNLDPFLLGNLTRIHFESKEKALSKGEWAKEEVIPDNSAE